MTCRVIRNWARLHAQIMKLDNTIAELKLEVAYLDYEKETDLVGSPTLLQALTLLSWLRLHPREQGCMHHNLVAELRECIGCSRLGLVGK